MQSSATEFLKPRLVDVQTLSSTHAKITLEPLERGFGYTLGNALRRILLSSMPGSAITEVKIEGVLHEYSTLEGVQEDGSKSCSISRRSRCACAVAGDAEASKGTGHGHGRRHPAGARREVVDPKHLIATLTKDASLNMELKVNRGRSCQPVTRHWRTGRAIGTMQPMPLPARFAAGHTVENARVGNVPTSTSWC
jgi:DNA-directed RNA polymerase subunit alpha